MSQDRTTARKLAPILRVEDVQKSIDYYVNVLGCSPGFRWGDPLTFASVCLGGDYEIYLCHQSQGQPGMWLHIEVDDVDELHARFLTTGARICQAPTNFPWGQREMNVEDLDSHRIRFSSPVKGEPEG